MITEDVEVRELSVPLPIRLLLVTVGREVNKMMLLYYKYDRIVN